MALSIAGISPGSVSRPVAGMGTAFLDSVLAPCGPGTGYFATANEEGVARQYAAGTTGRIQREGLPQAAILSLHRASVPGRGDLPPPVA